MWLIYRRGVWCDDGVWCAAADLQLRFGLVQKWPESIWATTYGDGNLFMPVEKAREACGDVNDRFLSL